MRKISAIAHYEYKMLMTRWATWGVFVAAVFLSLLEKYPSTHNLARLEFLDQPAYFLYRTISIDTLILVFGLLFLLSGRFQADRKCGLHHLIMTFPVQKRHYLSGKLLGAWLYTLTMLCLFLSVNLLVYSLAAPFEVDALDSTVSFGKALLVSVLPVSFFIGICSIALADLMDIRLFYLLAAIYFLINANTIDSARPMPFYLITSGDLVKLIWVHPKWTGIYPTSVLANCLFLIGSGLACTGLLGIGHRPWRTE